WPFSESIKKRACRYLLHRYLGNFLEEKLSLDQLSLDLVSRHWAHFLRCHWISGH
ncbi:unnamed protein product, partial [Tetraodon nigroviridis]